MLLLSWRRTPCASSTLPVILFGTVCLLSVGHWWTTAMGVPWDAAVSSSSLWGAQGQGDGKQFRKNPHIHVKSCLHVPHKDQAWQFSPLWGRIFQFSTLPNSKFFVPFSALTHWPKQGKAKKQAEYFSKTRNIWQYFKSLVSIIFHSLIYEHVLGAW